ncbi:MAG: dimethyl sulfoxide reductase anchor subunit family protein [Halorhodospira sp.]
MHPAWSVVLFTLLSGAGYGFAALFALVDLLGLGGPVGQRELLAAVAIAGVLITVGLVASAGHLANPRNAWRSFARFRTSWLSREAVLSVLFYPAALLYVGPYYLLGLEHNALTATFAVLTGVLALATVVATGMIYACVRAIREWGQGLTPVNYLLIGLGLGAALLTALRAAFGADPVLAAGLGVTVLLAAAVTKGAWYLWNARPGSSSKATALGLGASVPLRLMDAGHTAGNFLTWEFQYPLPARRARVYRGAALLGTFGVPIPALAAVALGADAVWAYVALGSAVLGALVERWLVFAEARHAVRLYYDEDRL